MLSDDGEEIATYSSVFCQFVLEATRFYRTPAVILKGFVHLHTLIPEIENRCQAANQIFRVIFFLMSKMMGFLLFVMVAIARPKICGWRQRRWPCQRGWTVPRSFQEVVLQCNKCLISTRYKEYKYSRLLHINQYVETSRSSPQVAHFFVSYIARAFFQPLCTA
jgi:hypothetical protein